MKKLELKKVSQLIEFIICENEAFSHISVNDAKQAVKALVVLDVIIKKYSNEKEIV